jgi:hypothetical protein
MPQGTGNSGGNEQTGIRQVVDFTQAREARMEEKRRKAERIFFKNLLSVYCVVGNHQMRPIELIEVSEDGCSFQVPFDPKDPWPNRDDELPIRFYFSQDTYIPLNLKIENSRPSIENGTRYVRFGCSVDKSLSSYAAFEQFVRFLKLYSEHAHKDMGDVSVFYL